MNDLKRKTILLVEDEAVISLMQKRILEKNGFEVIQIFSGEGAVESCLKNPEIDLILMDINLGRGMDGPEAASIILQNRDIPVVFLSNHTEPEVVEKTEKITSYGYVVKNSGETVLIASIKMAFRLYNAQVKLKEKEKALRESEERVRKKLETILSPKGDLGDIELTDILDIEKVQSLLEGFYRFTGMRSSLLDLSGKVLCNTPGQEICLNYHLVNPETYKNCLESDTVLSKGIKLGEYKLYRCKNNLTDMATPIFVDQKHLGNIFLGQFFFDDEEVDLELFREQARRYGFDEEAYLRALEKVPRWSRKEAEKAINFYAKLAEVLSTLGYSNIRLARALKERERLLDKLQESERNYRTLIENQGEGISFVDPEEKFLFVNPATGKIFGMDPKALAGRNIAEFVDPEQYAAIRRETEKRSRGEKSTYEIRILRSDGECRDLFVTAIPRFNRKGEFIGTFGNFHDITEQKRMEGELKKTVEEKELLFKELQHRVKNNLAMINSLIALEKSRVTEESGYEVLTNLESRISVISELYGLLHEGKTKNEITLNLYLEKICKVLEDNLTLANIRINMAVSDQIPLDSGRSTSLGLILNELLTNACKYAFPGNRGGTIRVELIKDAKTILLVVSDDGIGLPADFTLAGSQGFGFKLVEILTESLKGTFSYSGEGETSFRVSFPL